MPYEPEYVITLVHGTFAPRSQWTLENSHFRCILQHHLGGRVVYSRFEWSGSNRQSKRDDAASQLRSHLAEIKDKFPNSKHFIISHSHGGNIAIDAIRGSLDGFISGVVCMNTPFLNYHKRNIVSYFGLLMLFAILSLIGTLLLRLNPYNFDNYHEYIKNISRDYLSIIVYCISIIISAMLYFNRNKLTKKIRINRDMFIHKRNVRNRITRTRFLSIVGSGDEVVDLSVLFDAPVRLTYIIISMKILLAIFIFYSIFLIYNYSIGVSEPDPINIIGDAITNSAFRVFLLTLFGGVVGFGLTVFTRVMPFRASFDELLIFPFVQLTLGVIPLSVGKVEYREYALGGGFLNHSAVYDSTRAMLRMALWIQKTD